MHWLFLAVLLFVLPIRNDLAVAELVSKYAPSPSAFVEVRGMQVHYRVQGKGPVLVLLHGMASSLHTWEGWVAVLEKNYTVVTLDLPGWGLTGPDPQKRYRTADQVDFLKAFTSQLGLTRFFLGGNSMGGNFAWNYALRYPADVLGLMPILARLLQRGFFAPCSNKCMPTTLNSARHWSIVIMHSCGVRAIVKLSSTVPRSATTTRIALLN